MPEPLSRQEATRLIEAAARGRYGLRDRALLVLMWRGGARCAEALSVRLCDVWRREPGRPEAGGVLRIHKPKGALRARTPAKPRTVGLDWRALKLVEEWIARRAPDAHRALELEGRSYSTELLFRTTRGRPIQTSHARRLVPRIAARAGIFRRVHPHALRHTYAVELWEEFRDLVLVMNALGHHDPKTTMTYLHALGALVVDTTAQRRDW